MRGSTEWLALHGERAAVWVVLVAVLLGATIVLSGGLPFDGGESDQRDRIEVEQTSEGGYVLTPADGNSERGLVFYPGGRVPPEAYVSSLAPLAREANTTVAIVKMPLNLAVLDQNAADRVLSRNDEIDRWYVGGHSLGGAMACRYASDRPQRVSGVVLFAAYCDRSIAETTLRVLSVRGEADAVLDIDAYERNRVNLPNGTSYRVLPGVNHSQFGNYTDQRGDRASGTPYELAHRRLAEAVVPWFSNETDA
jgi:alpha-beta hydrolase superfamily lysophospholipase